VAETSSAPVRGRLAALDGLRLVAALLVVFYHYVGQGTHAWGQDTTRIFSRTHPVVSYGWTGVYLFFLISGFVICMSGWGRPLGSFFASRAARLYPAYWFAIIATTAVIAAFPSDATLHPPHVILANLTMVQDAIGVPNIDAVYWTLWAELRFYLLFAIVVWRGATYRRVVLFCMLWSVAALYANYSGDTMIKELIMPDYAPFFVAGVAMYLVYRFGSTPLLWAIVAAAFVLGNVRLTGELGQMQQNTGHAGSWSVLTLVLASYFAVVGAVALGWLSWARWRWLTVAGALTYPLYLLHEVIGWTLIGRLHGYVPKWVLLFGVIGAMLGLSWLVHRFVERPVGRRIRKAIEQSLATIRLPERPAATIAPRSGGEPVTERASTGVDPDAEPVADGSPRLESAAATH
jgi:peptidoglycan/LPS O-acetylase OafA/YrhL